MATAKYYDVTIVGAGLSGLYAIQKLRETNLTFRCLERYDDLGGTWYKNNYPGCLLDSETLSYQFSFSKELVNEFDWSSRFARQPEVLSYVNYAAEKFDWRKDIDFGIEIKNCVWDEQSKLWTLSNEKGDVSYQSRFVLFAAGPLSEPIYPEYPGREDFKGMATHSLHWSKEFDDLSGKRVAVIGTGATAIQIITEVSKQDCDLTVFQRNPDWSMPLGNAPLTDAERTDFREHADEEFDKLDHSFAGFFHAFQEGSILDLTPEQQQEFLEKKYNESGFGLWLGNYPDLLFDPAANKVVSDFVANKIRSRVKDQAIAEKLIPKTHGFGGKRVPMESGYYESYNRPNVHLVDLLETPIERYTETGIKTSEKDYEFDVIIYATGFNALIGSFKKLNIVGENGLTLNDYWKDGVKSFHGMNPHGFPNAFMPLGPLNGGTFCNFPRCIENNMNWVVKFLDYANKKGIQKITARQDKEAEWVATVAEAAAPLLASTVPSWFNQGNAEGEASQFLLYAGGLPDYKDRLNYETENGYPGYEMS